MPGTYRQLTWRHDPTLHAPARYRRACMYRAFIPALLGDLDISMDAQDAGAVSEAESAIRALNAKAEPAHAPLARLLLRTESIASSKVEGLQLGVRDLARSEARSDSGGKVSPTGREILGNIEAMELAINRGAKASAFTMADLVAIHRRLMRSSPVPHVAGRIRDEQNWIGGNDYNPCGASFVPPPSEDVERLLGDMFAAVNDDRLPPVMQAALVHAQFETIHPFHDGNGRTGRALIHVVLRRRGLAPDYVPPISVVLSNKRDGYIAGLTGFRDKDVVPWIRHFADATVVAADHARSYLAAVERLQNRWRTRLARHVAPRSDAAAWELISALPAHPMLTGTAAIAATGRARAAVYEALNQLEQAGVIVAIGTSRRNRVWEAAGLFDLLEGLQDGRVLK